MMKFKFKPASMIENAKIVEAVSECQVCGGQNGKDHYAAQKPMRLFVINIEEEHPYFPLWHQRVICQYCESVRVEKGLRSLQGGSSDPAQLDIFHKAHD